MDMEEAVHELLKVSMQKEIDLMREVLANLHQEELSLLMSDRQSWARVMEQRSDMIVELKLLRMSQAQVFKRLTSGKERPKLEEILPVQETISCEILSLLDQILALVERTNLQNCRNDMLFYETKSLKLPPKQPYPIPQASPRTARRKTTVAEYLPRKQA